ncbi:MAG: flagellar hook-length control protein FliK [Firmicutes bacterium]|nr:flagellar hook-length control protein FliK [Bacillota bacterium]
MGGKAFETTLRQVLGQDGNAADEKRIDSTIADDETGKKAASGRDPGDGEVALGYLGYGYIQSVDLDAAGENPVLDAAVETEVDPSAAGKGIAWALREMPGTEGSLDTVLEVALPLDVETIGKGIADAANPRDVETSALSMEAEASFGISRAPSAVPSIQGIDLAGRNSDRIPISGGLGENPLESREKLAGGNAALNHFLTQLGTEAADGGSRLGFLRTQPRTSGSRGGSTSARLPLKGEGAISLGEVQGIGLADELRVGVVAAEDHEASLYAAELSALEGRILESIELVDGVLAMAQNPGQALETSSGALGVWDGLETKTENLFGLETETAVTGLEEPAHLPTLEGIDLASLPGERQSFYTAGDPLGVDNIEGPSPGYTDAFLAASDLSGYELVVEQSTEQLAFVEFDGERIHAKTDDAKGRGTASSPSGVGVGTATVGAQETIRTSEAESAVLPESVVSMTVEAHGNAALDDEIPVGQEIEADSQEPEAKDISSKVSGQDVQNTSDLPSYSQQVSQTGTTLEMELQQPNQVVNLRPQHPAPGTAVSPSQVVEQIIRGVELNVKGENGEIRLQLKPDSLGEVEVRIAAHNGIVSAEFIAESQRVKSLIEAGLDQLKQQLMEQGLNIQELTVQVGGGSSYSRDYYPTAPETNARITWWQSGSRLAQGAAGSTQARHDGWGSTIDYRV